MKNSKFSLAIIAVVFGLTAAFGFKAPEPKAFTNPYWEYNGSGDPTQPVNYTKLSGMPDCSGTDAICAIQAPANGNEPVISSGLKTRIETLNTSDGDVFLQP
jgi:hypothetical protein